MFSLHFGNNTSIPTCPPRDGLKMVQPYLGGCSCTVAAVQVCVGAGRAVLRSQVHLGVEDLRHGGVALLAGRLLGVQRHFGTFDDDVVDFVLFPSEKNKHGGNNLEESLEKEANSVSVV